MVASDGSLIFATSRCADVEVEGCPRGPCIFVLEKHQVKPENAHGTFCTFGPDMICPIFVAELMEAIIRWPA